MLHKKSGNFAESGKNLKPIFGRIGSKFSLIKPIIKVIPYHTTYVEAFVGGGSIFWNKLPAEHSVINDLDTELINAYENLKKTPLSQLEKLDYLDLDNLDKHTSHLYKKSKTSQYKTDGYKKCVSNLVSNLEKINSGSSTAEKLLKYFKINRGTFNSSGKSKIYFNIDFKPYIAKMDIYKRLLKDTTITNKNYIDVIEEYDSPTTFFLLDPPYEKSDKLYKNGKIDYEKMRDILSKIKGKFLLTINDSEYISDVFSGFIQKKVITTNTSNSPVLKTKGRNELFISNYELGVTEEKENKV